MTLNFEHLLPPNWQKLVQTWLDEDIPSFDVGGFVVGDKEQTAVLYGKTDGVLAGRPFFERIFSVLDCKVVEWFMSDGDRIDTTSAPNKKVVIAKVRGSCRQILLGERTALNTISRCSGVATITRAAVEKATQHGWKGHLAGTRKTTPGFRLVEKYALIVGGGATHRNDLSQMVMLKDNHIVSAGGIAHAVAAAKLAAGFSMKIEVETGRYEDAVEAAQAGADIVMLDNFEPAELKPVASRLKAEFPHVIIEASGGITADTVQDFFSEGVDVISQGALTHGYRCLDFSLKILPASKLQK
ncbi:unnamed protein product [Discosporangium mesarthrocarpum]